MIDPVVSQIIIAVIVNLPIWYLMRANFRKTNTDAYESLSVALQTSGKTINDLFDMLGELPELREELAQVKSDWITDNKGAWANHDKLIEVHVPPPYVPKKRYSITGPLPPVQQGKSGFGRP